MGNSFSCGYPMFCNRHRQVEPKELLLMNNIWKTNDILYKRIRMEREKLEEKKSGSLVRIVAEFSPCKASGCRCKKGVFDEVECDNHGWKNSICTRAGCKHPLSDHASHVMSATRTEFAATIKVVFDIINIKGTLENTSKKPKTERIILVEDVFVSIYHVLLKTLRYDPFTAPNIDKIYGTPPFEKTNINQILLNFCVQKFGKKNSVLDLKDALKITKFVLKYFNTWFWTLPDQLVDCNPRRYSTSYYNYYRRYLLYCCMPRLVHSITPRYKASKIFGCQVLKYTLITFKRELQVWCYKHNIMWEEHTKKFCLNYLPIYMDLLTREVFNDNSYIYIRNFKLSDVHKKILFLENS